MSKHILSNKPGYSEFYCIKCDQCMCFKCVRSKAFIDRLFINESVQKDLEVINIFYKEDGSPMFYYDDINEYDKNVILEFLECPTSEEDWIIRQIIE